MYSAGFLRLALFYIKERTSFIMLREVDLNKKMEKSEWDMVSEELKLKINVAQQQLMKMKIPMIILLEGWGGAKKGEHISMLINNLDPHGFSVHSTSKPSQDEQRFPWLHRFWVKLPKYGNMAIFDRSWYRDISIGRTEKDFSEENLKQHFNEIKDFEKQITDDGYLLIKIFLHISKEDQKKQFEKLGSKAETSWRVTPTDWKRNKDYDKICGYFDEMINETDKDYAPWTVIEARDKRWAANKIFRTILNVAETRIANQTLNNMPEFTGIRTSSDTKILPMQSLKDVDLTQNIEYDKYRKELKACQKRLGELHNLLYQEKIPLVIAYEGWDAAGKGGNIRRIARGLDPRGYEVVPIAAPTQLELDHHYLWRFWKELPKDGHISIFDRTWYGRVMVERIEGFCTAEQWGRAYDEINHFEKSITSWGGVVVKFWVHIDKEEQLNRFTLRQNTPEKQYKITEDDWRNRDKWDLYETAVEEMLQRTNTKYAPWHIIESNDKCFARIKAMKVLIKTLEKRLELD